MENSANLGIMEVVSDLLMKLPAVFTQMLDNLERNKKQQETCSSSVMKTVLENVFQLGGTLHINFAAMSSKILEYFKIVDEIYDIRYKSLIDFGNGVKQAEYSEDLLSEENKKLIALTANLNSATFSRMSQSIEICEKADLLNEFVTISSIYNLATISNLILCANNRNETIELAEKGTEVIKMGVGAIPVIGPLLGLGLTVWDGIKMIIKIAQDHLNDNASSPDMQTTDSQLRQIELQYACLQKALEAQKPLSSFIDDCLARALAEKESLETSEE